MVYNPWAAPPVQIVQACPARSGSSRLIPARPGLFASPCSFGLIWALPARSGSSGFSKFVQAHMAGRTARPGGTVIKSRSSMLVTLTLYWSLEPNTETDVSFCQASHPKTIKCSFTDIIKFQPQKNILN